MLSGARFSKFRSLRVCRKHEAVIQLWPFRQAKNTATLKNYGRPLHVGAFKHGAAHGLGGDLDEARRREMKSGIHVTWAEFFLQSPTKASCQAWPGQLIPDASRRSAPTPQDFGCISFLWVLSEETWNVFGNTWSSFGGRVGFRMLALTGSILAQGQHINKISTPST